MIKKELFEDKKKIANDEDKKLLQANKSPPEERENTVLALYQQESTRFRALMEAYI